MPDGFGTWNSVYKRFARWSDAEVWQRVFAELCKDADFEDVFIDSTIVRAHQHTWRVRPKKGRTSPWAFAWRAERQNPRGGVEGLGSFPVGA